MDEQGFLRFLKRSGKKTHVVEGLVDQVLEFEAYLANNGQSGIEAAGEQDIREYAGRAIPSVRKKRMRALALYYRFAENDSLAKLAGSIREQEVAKTRKAFKLRDFLGVDAEDAARLEAIGIVDVNQMLAAGENPAARALLADRTGISPETILELVKLSDLSRIGALRRVRARLYYDAGLDTPDKFTRWEPEALRQMLVEFVEKSGFEGIAPLPKETRNAIATARKLKPVVEY